MLPVVNDHGQSSECCRFYVEVRFQLIWVSTRERDADHVVRVSALGEKLPGHLHRDCASAPCPCWMLSPCTLVLTLHESFIRFMIGEYFLPPWSFLFHFNSLVQN